MRTNRRNDDHVAFVRMSCPNCGQELSMFEEPEPETSARDRETYMVAANTEADLHQVKQRLDELIDKVNALHLGPNSN